MNVLIAGMFRFHQGWLPIHEPRRRRGSTAYANLPTIFYVSVYLMQFGPTAIL
jgi:hypothetical protein